ncbi:MAG: hypothetical protein ACRD5J_18645, partial [Nitrososphaeraceae archaeon]
LLASASHNSSDAILGIYCLLSYLLPSKWGKIRSMVFLTSLGIFWSSNIIFRSFLLIQRPDSVIL